MNNNRITNILVTILIVLVSILVLLQFKQQLDIKNNISKAIASLYIPKGIDGKDAVDGYTPIKGVDYFDGENGKDSLSTHTIEKETITKEVPIKAKDGVDGLTIEIQCNVSKNRWEYKYTSDSSWKVLNDSPVKCTIDTL